MGDLRNIAEVLEFRGAEGDIGLVNNTTAAFSLDRNGHPSGRVHLVRDGVAVCGRETAEPIPHLAEDVVPMVVTCPKCKAAL